MTLRDYLYDDSITCLDDFLHSFAKNDYPTILDRKRKRIAKPKDMHVFFNVYRYFCEYKKKERNADPMGVWKAWEKMINIANPPKKQLTFSFISKEVK